MKALHQKAYIGLLRVFVGLSATIFLPAWTLDYPQAWIFLVAFFLPTIAITQYLMKHDSELLKRRMKVGRNAEKQANQKIIQAVAAAVFIATYIFSALDYRFGWSATSYLAVLMGDILTLLGFDIVFRVFQANSFAAGTIETSKDHKIVSTGPYAIIRHPMYSGVMILMIGTPLGLGSLWGILLGFLFIPILAWRLIEEENFLVKNLSGYSAYCKKTIYRLVPFIW